MEKLKTQKNIIESKNNIDDYIYQIKGIVLQLQSGHKIGTCRCSYHPLRELVEMSINGEIGEEFRLISNLDEELIKRLAEKINNNSL